MELSSRVWIAINANGARQPIRCKGHSQCAKEIAMPTCRRNDMMVGQFLKCLDKVKEAMAIVDALPRGCLGGGASSAATAHDAERC